MSKRDGSLIAFMSWVCVTWINVKKAVDIKPDSAASSCIRRSKNKASGNKALAARRERDSLARYSGERNVKMQQLGAAVALAVFGFLSQASADVVNLGAGSGHSGGPRSLETAEAFRQRCDILQHLVALELKARQTARFDAGLHNSNAPTDHVGTTPTDHVSVVKYVLSVCGPLRAVAIRQMIIDRDQDPVDFGLPVD